MRPAGNLGSPMKGCGVREGGKGILVGVGQLEGSVSDAGGCLWIAFSGWCMSLMGDRGGSSSVGTSWVLRWENSFRFSRRGRVLYVISSIRRCLRMFLCGVFHMSGHLVGLSLTRRGR